jgi:hypothetical protein
MAIEKELLARLLVDYKKPEDLIGETGLLKKKRHWWQTLTFDNSTTLLRPARFTAPHALRDPVSTRPTGEVGSLSSRHCRTDG